VVTDMKDRSTSPEATRQSRNALARGVDVSTDTKSASAWGSTNTGHTVTRSIPASKASLAISKLKPFGTVMRTSCMAYHMMTTLEQASCPYADPLSYGCVELMLARVTFEPLEVLPMLLQVGGRFPRRGRRGKPGEAGGTQE
jgi:hypothetical protein